MRRKIILLLVGAVVLPAAVLVSTYSSQASPGSTSVDLGITGSTVAGYTQGDPNTELPVVFTMTNHSSSTSVSVDFYFTVVNATADGSDYTCPLISNHHLINPDTPACEPGFLGHGKGTSAAILVTPTIDTGSVTVKACADDESGYPDPVSSNNCKTISIMMG